MIGIREAVTSTLLGLVIGFGAVTFAAEDAGSRRYEHLMVQASELRHEANRIRNEAKSPESVRGRTKSLEDKADRLEAQARKLDSTWPPRD